jgi:hypothetical protein
MSDWDPAELTAFGEADEIEITSVRPDGSLRPFVTIWAVRVGEDLYVRSAHGPENPWFRGAAASGIGRIRAAGRERDVAFGRADPELAEPLHAEYHRKYDPYGAAVVDPVVSPLSATATLRLTPR